MPGPQPLTVTGRWEVVVPLWRPASLNELLAAGPYGANRLKKRDLEFVRVYAWLAGVPRASGPRRVSLEITVPKGQRRWDPDAFWKSLLDALVRDGKLVDDGPKWCLNGPVSYVRGEELLTKIIIEDVAADPEVG